MYRAQYSRPTADPRLEVCALAHDGPLPPGWLASGFVINQVVHGEADLFARGAAHRVGRGVVVLADAGEFRRVARRHSAMAQTRSLTCDATLFHAAITERMTRTVTPHFADNTSADPRVASALATLYAAIDGGAPLLAIEVAVEQLFDCLAADLRLSWAPASRDHPAVRRVRELIDDRVTDDLSLSELVTQSGLSRAHLIRAFTRAVGVTPYQYLLHARVARARELLASGLSPARTAAAVGFCDQSHLTRCFTRMMGIGPAAYRRTMLTTRGGRRQAR